MSKISKLNISAIVTGILINLIMTIIFITFITLGYKSTTENAAIQDDAFRTHFKSRLILKSINGLNRSRADMLLAIKNRDTNLIAEAEDQVLGAKSNYQRLLSEQMLNKSRVSDTFKPSFLELQKLYDDVFKNSDTLKNEKKLLNILSKTDDLAKRMHDEESKLWIDESLKLQAFSQIKERNLHIFYALTFCFILIQLVFIYFTIIRYRLNKKISLQHEHLLLQTRLSTLGMMSAELAHEINSPLMVIDGRLKKLHNELLSTKNENEKLYANIDIIKRNSRRIQSIIKSFKTMSKSGDNDDFEPIEVNTIYEDVQDLIQQKLSDEKISFSFLPSNVDFSIEARRIQIVQVITNLINNSIDAIKGSTNERWVHVENEVSNDQIIIRVTDSGLGIDKEHVENIFDPFYTTKNSNEGTGLGLSISKKIMKDHAGDLYYNPESPNTQFVLTFKHNKKAHSHHEWAP